MERGWAAYGRTVIPSNPRKAASNVATRPSADFRATVRIAASAKLSPRSPCERKVSRAGRNTSAVGMKMSSLALRREFPPVTAVVEDDHAGAPSHTVDHPVHLLAQGCRQGNRKMSF